MTTAEQKADEVWKLLLDNSDPKLPPEIALDMVQEETGGDRDGAKYELEQAAIRVLEESARINKNGPTSYVEDALFILRRIAEKQFSRAVIIADALENDAATELHYVIADEHNSKNLSFFRHWVRWAQKALKSIDHLKLISEIR